MKKIAVLLFCCLIAAGGLTCTKKSKEAPDSFLHFNNLGEPEYLDPGLVADSTSHQIVLGLFEGLVEHDPKDLHPVPAVAERWTISDDKKVYTFFLRKNARWTDGQPVTARDFVYSWKRVLDPETASRFAFALYFIKNGKPYNKGELKDPAQLGFKALDDFTLQVVLENPTPFILDLMCYPSFRPVRKEAVEKHGPRWIHPENIISNGPFKLQSWTPYKEITVVKNPSYWDAEQVRLAGIRYYPIEDVETGLKMYEAGELDNVYQIPNMKLPLLRGRADLLSGPHLSKYYYNLNVERPPLTDKRVRQALAMAIDRAVLTDEYLHDSAFPSSSMVPHRPAGYPPAPGLEFNPEKANRLLDEAGYKDRNTFPVLTIKYNTLEGHKIIAQVIQQMWKKHLGIQVKLHNEEWKSFLKTVHARDYEVARQGWIADYPDPMTFLDLFASYSSHNDTGWNHPEYDQWLAKALKESDTGQRFSHLRKAEELLLEESPIIPIYDYKREFLLKPYVKGFYHNFQDIHPPKWIYLSKS